MKKKGRATERGRGGIYFRAYSESRYDEKTDEAYWERLAKEMCTSFGPKTILNEGFGMILVRRRKTTS